MQESKTTKIIISSVIIIFLLQVISLKIIFDKLNKKTENLASTTNTLLTSNEEIQAHLTKNDQQYVMLSDSLYKEQKRLEELRNTVRSFNRQVDKLHDTVDDLEKLSTTDPQLLQKYSEIYFLNEHYVPSDLTVVDKRYDYDNGKNATVLSDMWPFLRDLLRDAKKDNISLLVLSGYRSFDEQATLKGIYTQQYGSGANKFSADQGYSEHQLGTTIDFTTPEIGEDLSKFENTQALDWLESNAYKYGFIMSYPKGNEYYVYEPWHWRFVGKDLARYLHKRNKHFYDLEQRKIDEYIPTLFDR